MLGGGFLRGEGTLVRYDAEGIADEVFLSVGVDVVDDMLSAVLLPRRSLGTADLEAYLDLLGVSMGRLIDHDQLFVVDGDGEWPDRRNAVRAETAADIRAATDTALDRSRARGTVHMLDLVAIEVAVGAAEARALRDWYQDESFRGRRDFLIEGAQVPPLPEELVAFYESRDRQVLRCHRADGAVRVTVDAAPDGPVGETRTVEYGDEPPFVRIVCLCGNGSSTPPGPDAPPGTDRFTRPPRHVAPWTSRSAPARSRSASPTAR